MMEILYSKRQIIPTLRLLQENKYFISCLFVQILTLNEAGYFNRHTETHHFHPKTVIAYWEHHIPNKECSILS